MEGGYITELKNVVLLKNNCKKNILLSNIATNSELDNNVWINNGKNKIAYQKINGEKLSVFVFDMENNSQKAIINFDILPLEKCENYNFDNIIWSNDDTKIILRANCDENYSRYLIDLKNKDRIYNF